MGDSLTATLAALVLVILWAIVRSIRAESQHKRERTEMRHSAGGDDWRSQR